MTHTKEIIGRAPHRGDPAGEVLLIAANPAVSEQTGWPIGCWAAELTHPYHALELAGYRVTIASPSGGRVEFDGYSDPGHESGYSAHDLLTLGFMNAPGKMELLRQTPAISELDHDRFDALFLAGGQSPMYTFRGNRELMRFVASFYETGKPTALVCHATAILLDTELSTGRLLVEGKTWTGFSNAEEELADTAVGQRIQPFWIETLARDIANTSFTVKPPFTPFAIRDGNLISGQQQYSGAVAAALVLEALGES
jgi:putative intracellular protease/amidase